MPSPHLLFLGARSLALHSAPQNIVLLTIEAPNLQPAPATKLELKPSGFSFEAKVGDKAKGIEEKEYKFDLDTFGEIIPEVSGADATQMSVERSWACLSERYTFLHALAVTPQHGTCLPHRTRLTSRCRSPRSTRRRSTSLSCCARRSRSSSTGRASPRTRHGCTTSRCGMSDAMQM